MASSDTLGKLLAIADKTSGRDNLCRWAVDGASSHRAHVYIPSCYRLLQYASKFLSWALERRTSGLELAAKLKQLETSISTARKRTHFPVTSHVSNKALRASYLPPHLIPTPTSSFIPSLTSPSPSLPLSLFSLPLPSLSLFSLSLPFPPLLQTIVFRLGKSADHLRAALQTIHLTDVTLRVLITLNKLNRALYLIIDNLLWGAKMNLIKVNVEKWNNWAMKFWLLAILLGLSRDLYELFVVAKTIRRTTVPSGEQPSLHGAAVMALYTHPPLALDLIKNTADMFIPSAKLEVLHVSGGVVGIMGVVSSLASLMSLWNDQLKLKYS